MGWLVIRTAARCSWPHWPVVSLVLYLAATWSHFASCYQVTHESWLLIFLVGVLFYLTDRLWGGPPGQGASACWGLAGGFAMLAAPVLGPVWLALSAPGLVFPTRPPVRSFGVIAAAVLTPWVARNAIVFGGFIPMKSNVFFEFYQSNEIESDGVLNDETLDKHPFPRPARNGLVIER